MDVSYNLNISSVVRYCKADFWSKKRSHPVRPKAAEKDSVLSEVCGGFQQEWRPHLGTRIPHTGNVP